MATQTQRLGLTKPALTELADITVINANMDILDNAYAANTSPAYNLLDNSDFRNPVNQRGVTSATSWNYGPDRWKEYSGAPQVTFTFDAGGMTLNGTLCQEILSRLISSGKKYSAVLYMADGTVMVACGAVRVGGSTWTTFAEAESGNVSIELFCDTLNGSTISVRISAAGEKIRACALYEGEYTEDSLPPYLSKGYATELAECQRYYTQSWVGEDFDYAGYVSAMPLDEGYLPVCRFPVPMRINPTVTIFNPATGKQNAVGDWETSADVRNITPDEVSVSGFVPYNGKINFNVDTGYYYAYTASADL